MNPWDDPATSGVVTPLDRGPGDETHGRGQATRAAASPDELGRGAFAAVLQGADRHLPRDVAWKVATAGDRVAVMRLTHEATVLAALEHPNIVPIYDFDRDSDGTCRMALRIVRGQDLGRLIDQTPDAGARLRFIRHLLQATEAVAWAHRQGFVHRDLKPSNIMIGEFGETQVIDWGLASQIDAVRPVDIGVVLGTPQTMSPEQARGEQVDARSDVWSLGATLFHVIAGVPAFHGHQVTTIISALAKGERPSLRQAAKTAPRELLAICERAMAPEVEDRYPDARALAADLAAYVDGRQVGAYHYGFSGHFRRFVVRRRIPLAIVVVAGVLSVSIFVAGRSEVEQERGLRMNAQSEAQQSDVVRRGVLMRSNIESAKRESSLDLRSDALEAALGALEFGESPEARGVVGAYSRGARVRLQAEQANPAGAPCTHFQMAASGRMLCGTRAAWTVYDENGKRLARKEAEFRDVVFSDDGATVVMQRRDFFFERFDAVDGHPLGPGLTLRCNGRLNLFRSADWAVAQLGMCFHAMKRDQSVRADPCLHDYLQSVTVLADGTWAAVCRTGNLELGRLDEPVSSRVITAGLPPEVATQVTATLLILSPGDSVDEGYLLLGTAHGELLRVRLADAQIERRRTLNGRPLVRALSLEIDVFAARRAVVSIDSGGQDLIDVLSLESSGRLPRASVGMATWRSKGQLTTLDSRQGLLHWEISEGAPDLLEGYGGITDVDLDARGGVALAHDFGASLIDGSTGRLMVTREWPRRPNQDDNAKQVLITATGNVRVAVGMPGLASFALADSPFSADGDVRYMARLNDNRVVSDESRGLRMSGIDGEIQLATTGRSWVVGLASAGSSFAVLSDGKTRTAMVYDASPEPVLWWQCPTPGATAVALRMTPAGPELITVEQEGLAIHRTGECDVADFWPWTRGEIVRLEASPSGLWVAAGTRVGTLVVWDVTGRLVATFDAHLQAVSGLAFDPLDRWLVSTSWDGRVRFLGLDVLVQPIATVRNRLLGPIRSTVRLSR